MNEDAGLLQFIIALLIVAAKATLAIIIVGIPSLIIIFYVASFIYNKLFGNKEDEKGKNVKNMKSKGFTLIELLVVIIILGLLAAIIVPRVTGRVDEAKIETTKVQMKAIKDALEQYRLDNGRYPTTEQGLKALVEKPTIPPIPPRWKKYLDSVPKDAWGNDFIYISPGVNNPYELRSPGPDGEEGTEDDIDIWKE